MTLVMTVLASRTQRLALAAVLTAAVAILARSAHTTDADTHRYFAYCNALLGRPYDAFYVRTSNEWEHAFISGNRSQLNESDRTSMTVVHPNRRLTPYRDFEVEYPPGFFVAALPVGLLARNATEYKIGFGVWMSALLVLATWLCVLTSRYIAGSIPSIDISVGMCAAAFALGGVTIERYDALVSMLLCLMCW